jgi:signal transduction histidine kinase/CheY-like chemotaxis protein
VGSHSPENAYTDSDLKLLQVFGNSMVLWIRKNDLIAQLQESLKRNEETQLQLIQAEKLAGLGELMAGISHELNNPLSVVVGNTQLLMRQELPADVMERLEKMNHEALRSKRLVENLLRAARGEDVEGEEVNLNEIVEQSLSLLRYQVSLDNVTIETSLQEDLPPSVLDPFQIQQLIFNLVNNARQAMLATPKDRRTVRVVTELVEEGPPGGVGPAPSVHLQVGDTGPGIPKESIGRVFDPFFTTKEVGAGTGLGLSICYRIVQEFRGGITAGNHPDGGAVFDIWLPVSHEVEEAPEEPPVPEPGTKGASKPGLILIVDDEENICELVGEALGDAGHEVECAQNGQEALDRLEEIERPNAIILDLKMPVMDGREFYLRLEADDPELAERVFFLTGDTLSRDARSFLQNIDRPFMSKPFSLDELLERVETSMEC